MHKKGRQMQGIESLISQGVEIKGQVLAQGSIRIDGKIEGQLDIKGDLFVGEKGQVKGGIKVDNIIMGGKIEGDVQARGRFELTATGIMNGDIICATLSIEEGGILDGTSKMIKNTPEKSLGKERDLKRDIRP